MSELTSLATVLAAVLGVLAFAAESNRRVRGAIRETLELAEQFADHDVDLAKRLRDRAVLVAQEYLDERERPPYRVSVTVTALVLAIMALATTWSTGVVPVDGAPSTSLVAGIMSGAVALALRPAVAWLFDRVPGRALRATRR